ncbi:MAG: diacylglycerol kinase family lipid kinase [Anaerolineales bacterium]|nr:diacylglycerol kinase family lipid kinase [Anaerolineales bacterium]
MSENSRKLIINPNADMGKAWRQATDLRPVLQEFGGADWAGTVYPTHATELALEAARQGYDQVIALGGDGTVHEVVNGLMQVPIEERPKLGVVPMGSGNDFAFAVGAPSDPHKALRRALTGSPRKIDVGHVEDDKGRKEYWDNTLGIGFDATVTQRSHSLPVLRGFLMYFVALMQTIMLNHVPIKFEFSSDEETWEAMKLMLVICNGPREGGGFHVAPEAKPDDGVFHYATIEDVSRPMMFRLVPEVMRGTHVRFKSVKMGQCRSLALKADRPLYIHTDGEMFAGFGTDVRQLKITMHPAALEVVV